jgi:hypothetical protein
VSGNPSLATLVLLACSGAPSREVGNAPAPDAVPAAQGDADTAAPLPADDAAPAVTASDAVPAVTDAAPAPEPDAGEVDAVDAAPAPEPDAGEVVAADAAPAPATCTAVLDNYGRAKTCDVGVPGTGGGHEYLCTGQVFPDVYVIDPPNTPECLRAWPVP